MEIGGRAGAVAMAVAVAFGPVLVCHGLAWGFAGVDRFGRGHFGEGHHERARLTLQVAVDRLRDDLYRLALLDSKAGEKLSILRFVKL